MTDEQKRRVAELAKQGKSDPQIARIIGIGRCTIGKYRREVGIKPVVLKGVSGTKLSKAEQERRMMLYNKGLTDAALAVALNLSKEAVSDWRKRSGKLPANLGQHNTNRPMPKKYTHKPAPKGAICGTCAHWEPSKPESAKCKQCDHREMWEAV